MHTGIHGGPRYLALAAELRRQIASGQHRPGQLLASEHELARRRRLSRVTVRRASALLIGEGLLERRPGKGLFLCARPAGAPPADRRSARAALRTVQVVAGNLAWDSCLQIARGVQAAARAAGTEVQLHDAHGSERGDLELIRQLPRGNAQGAVVIALHGAAFVEALYALKLSGFPFVLVDQRLRDLAAPSVTADNHDGGRQLAHHLLALGHRRVAFIGDLEADTVQARLDGVRDAFGEAGLPFDRTLVADLRPRHRLGDWSPAVAAAVAALRRQRQPASAVIASCDAVARAVYGAAAGHGLGVPGDLSVVGFDDDPLASQLDPPLTTVRQPFLDLGRCAFTLLRKRLAGTAARIGDRVLAVRLVPRASTAPPHA
jgi:LacI family transcriptional regulator